CACYLVYQCTRADSFFFSSRRRHTRSKRDWSSDVCSSDLQVKCEPWGPLSRHHRACAYPSPAASDFPLHEEYSVSPCRRMQQLSKNGSGEMKGNMSHNDAGSVGDTEVKEIIDYHLDRPRGCFVCEFVEYVCVPLKIRLW